MRAKFRGTDFDARLFRIVEPSTGKAIDGVFEADIETCTILQFDLDEKGRARCTDWEPNPVGEGRRRHMKMVMRTHDFDVLDVDTDLVVASARRKIHVLTVESEPEQEAG